MSEKKPATVKVRFPESSYGIAAGEVRDVEAERAEELIASRLAEPVDPPKSA